MTPKPTDEYVRELADLWLKGLKTVESFLPLCQASLAHIDQLSKRISEIHGDSTDPKFIAGFNAAVNLECYIVDEVEQTADYAVSETGTLGLYLAALNHHSIDLDNISAVLDGITDGDET